MSTDFAFPFRCTSGFRPLQRLHIGHYSAVLQDIVRLQYVYKDCSFVFIADQHGRSRWNEKADFVNISKRTTEIARQLLAAGVDPSYTILYRQSDVPDIFEIMWFLAGVVTDAQLRHGHALTEHPLPTAGVYLYPLLMVADIISMKATNVAIGKDQKQHLELARDVARKLIRRFGERLLPIPDAVLAEPRLIHGVDSSAKQKRKMAVEFENDIPLFGDVEEINDRIDRIVTHPIKWGENLPTNECNLLDYAEALGGKSARETFEAKYGSSYYGYRDAKRDLKALFFDSLSLIRTRYAEWSDTEVNRVLTDGAVKAREHVAHFVFEIRDELDSAI